MLYCDRLYTGQNRTTLGNRVVECYQTIKRNLDQLGHRINNTGIQPIDIAELIYYLSKENVGVQLLMSESFAGFKATSTSICTGLNTNAAAQSGELR